MTKDELALAQFLLTTWASANAHADKLDADRNFTSRAAALDNIARNAEQCFHRLTGRSVTRVHLHELSTEEPAEWTHEVEPWTWGMIKETDNEEG